ncbi:MAG: hypothetical protein KBG75_13455 [Pseudomonadales bacterium]|nr:hypothetical protein [Pseudomonadales bacterium]
MIARTAPCADNLRAWLSPALILFVMCVVFWWPALAQGKILIHGETIHFDLLMMVLQSRVFDPDPGILWNDMLYGGFPLFAEGQAGFAQPLKLLLALLFDPASAMMAYHFLAMFTGAFGMLFLGREIGLSRAAALFASVAAAFSISWIFFHNNMVCAGTLAFAPWVLLGTERWLRRPDLASILWLGLPAALMVLSGYPHFAHGVAIHIACRLLVEVCYREGRMQAGSQLSSLLLTGSAAVALAVGLCAVQLLPLVELVGESHRSEGIGLLYPSSFLMHVRGLLFSFLGHYTDPAAPNLQGLGSAFVFAIFLCGVAICPDRRVVTHAVAAVVLYNLGIQELSPVFRVAYEHSLIPGMHAFRFMWGYVIISVIGCALVAGGALDALTGRVPMRSFGRLDPRTVGVAALLAASVGVAVLSVRYFHLEYGRLQLLIAVAFAPICLALFAAGHRKWLSRIAVAFLMLECVTVRFNVFHFAERSILDAPAQLGTIRGDATAGGDFRIMDMTEASSFGYMPPDSPDLEGGFRSMMASLTPMANLLWNLSSIDSVSSLGLHRRHLLYDITREEFFERTGEPGRRFIDVLGVRYVTARSGLQLALASDLYARANDWGVYRNSNALPRFQLYHTSRAFETPEAALRHWPERATDEIYIDSAKPPPLVSAAQASDADAQLTVVQHQPTRSVVRVVSAAPVWLFMADANYPGWHARMDGMPTTLYSAQVLGKAVELPPGEHLVEFEFIPATFRLGLGVSALGILVALLILVLHWRNGSKLRTQTRQGISVASHAGGD